MRIRGLICIAVGLMLTAAAARAEEVTIVSGVLGPEGPLFVDVDILFPDPADRFLDVGDAD